MKRRFLHIIEKYMYIYIKYIYIQVLYIYVCVNTAYILMTITFLPLCRSSYSFTHIERQESWLQFKPWTLYELYGIAAKKKTKIAIEFHDDPLATIHFPLPSFLTLRNSAAQLNLANTMLRDGEKRITKNIY